MSSGTEALAAGVMGLFVCLAHSAEEPGGCAAEPAFRQLDFWVGNWEVHVAGERVGHDRVAKTLKGCAVTESWTASDGTLGSSLFYFSVSERLWKQVWVTDLATRPGGLKEKHLIARFADGGLRFQGEISLPDGSHVIDRTTLRPTASGSVSQRIEISRDGGEHWSTTFNAEYRPVAITNELPTASPSGLAPALPDTADSQCSAGGDR